MAHYGTQDQEPGKADGAQLTPGQIEKIREAGQLSFRSLRGGYFRIVQLLNGTGDIGPRFKKRAISGLWRQVYPRNPGQEKPVKKTPSKPSHVRPRASRPREEEQLRRSIISLGGIRVYCPHCDELYLGGSYRVRPGVKTCRSCSRRFIAVR